MIRPTCFSGSAFFFGALVLTVISSISLPSLPRLYLARTHLNGAVIQEFEGLSEIRFGIWGTCYYGPKIDRICLKTNYVYITQGNDVAVVDWSWARQGLIVQPIATCVTVFVFFFGLFDGSDIHVLGLVAFALLSLTAAFVMDIVLYLIIRSKLHKLGPTDQWPGPGFALTIASLVLLVVGGYMVRLHHKKEKETKKTIKNKEALLTKVYSSVGT